MEGVNCEGEMHLDAGHHLTTSAAAASHSYVTRMLITGGTVACGVHHIDIRVTIRDEC